MYFSLCHIDSFKYENKCSFQFTVQIIMLFQNKEHLN